MAEERRRHCSSGKAVAGKALAAQVAGKRSTFLSKNDGCKLEPNQRE